MKNTLDVCVGTITWWLFGYSFAFGNILTFIYFKNYKIYSNIFKIKIFR